MHQPSWRAELALPGQRPRKGEWRKSPLLGMFLPSFLSGSHGYFPAGFSFLGARALASPEEGGQCKYLTSGVVPPLPTSTCPSSHGVTSTFILVGMQWERGFLSGAEGLSDWIVTLCPSVVADQPSASAILSLSLCGERRFSTAADRRYLSLQTKPAREKSVRYSGS